MITSTTNQWHNINASLSLYIYILPYIYIISAISYIYIHTVSITRTGQANRRRLVQGRMRTSSHFGPIPGEVRDPSLSRETHQRFPGLKKEHFANKNWTWSSLVWTQLSDVNPCQSPRNLTQHISYQIQVSCISNWFQLYIVWNPIINSHSKLKSPAHWTPWTPRTPWGPLGPLGPLAVTSAWSASWLVSLELNSAQRLAKSGGSRSQAASYIPTYIIIYVYIYIYTYIQSYISYHTLYIYISLYIIYLT